MRWSESNTIFWVTMNKGKLWAEWDDGKIMGGIWFGENGDGEVWKLCNRKSDAA